jgi:8-oxo-dGTP diphosphatase
MDNRPKVGVAVLVIKDRKVLLGKRKSAHGQGTWSAPGGHLEFGETFEACAKRELLEETGLIAASAKKLWLSNDIFLQSAKHYVTIFMIVEKFSGNIQNMESDKCEGWDWFDLNNFPSPLFLPLENLVYTEKILERYNR